MEIFTSYFYHVRFFKENMLPMSTAMWDPKWFHDNRGQEHIFKDKRGIINGIRMPAFIPGKDCTDLCAGLDQCETKDPKTCKFLTKYREQLDSLKFKKVMKHLEACSNLINSENPMIVLLFHETPDKKCSERDAVQEWFNEHGVTVTELKYPISKNYSTT